MIYDASLDELLQKVWDGQRINQAEALRLYSLPLEELGALADRRRQLAKARAYDGRGNEIVTYNVDRNVNYTNVCNVYCKFCAFYRTEKDDDSYVITFDEMDRKIEETIALGGTQILMQGGHHPKLTKQWYLDLLVARQKQSFRGSTSTASVRASSSISAKCSTNRWRKSSAISRRQGLARFPVVAGKSSWTACASAFRRSRR